MSTDIIKTLKQGALPAAQALLGWRLVHNSPQGVTSGYIVETEAYTMEDPASHAFAGLTKRNAALFGRAGTIYVYFTYGMHYCVNIVTGDEHHGQGVLIRALEPANGIELMRLRRKVNNDINLTNGPAKLVEAMAITRAHNLTHVLKGSLRLEPGIKPEKVVQTTRIGIKRAIDQPWRFYIVGNSYVSKP